MNVNCPVCNAELCNEVPAVNFPAKRLDCSNCGVFFVSNNLLLKDDLSETAKMRIKSILNKNNDKIQELKNQKIYPYFLSVSRDYKMIQEAKIENEMLNSKYYFFILK